MARPPAESGIATGYDSTLVILIFGALPGLAVFCANAATEVSGARNTHCRISRREVCISPIELTRNLQDPWIRCGSHDAEGCRHVLRGSGVENWVWLKS